MIEFKAKWAKLFELLSPKDQKRILAKKYKEREVRALGKGVERTSDLVVHPKHGLSVRKVTHGMTPKGAANQGKVERDLHDILNKRGAKAKRRFAKRLGKDGERRYYEYVKPSALRQKGVKHRSQWDPEVRKVLSDLRGKGHKIGGDWYDKGNQVGGKIVDISPKRNAQVLSKAERRKAYGSGSPKRQADLLKKAIYEGKPLPNRVEASDVAKQFKKEDRRNAALKAVAAISALSGAAYGTHKLATR
jgi:hypothetical protein